MSKKLIQVGIRKLDSVGRIVLPNSIRQNLNWVKGDKLEFIYDNETVIIKKIVSKPE